MPKWGETDITKLTDHALNHWVEFSFRVEDRKATVALHGRQPRNGTRQRVLVPAAAATLGNLDQALLYVWNEAVADQVVERRFRPMIDRSLGEDSEPRAFIDEKGVLAVALVMTNEWVASNEGHSSDLKRLLRSYIAMIACTGIRPGLEAKRVRIGDVRFEQQDGKPVILITVRPCQGKHPRPREVIVFEGGMEFNARRLLHELIEWRKSQGATDDDPLFAYRDGREPIFRDVLDTVLRKANTLIDPLTGEKRSYNALIDPLTGEKRSSYSFRHFFATRLIERKLSVPFIAAWLGTSSHMIEKNYNRFIIAQQAASVNGGNVWNSVMRETDRADPAVVAQLSGMMKERTNQPLPGSHGNAG
jgi:integrase